jgi:beta-glucosidase-like glycosyl hydrolase/CubicO group peptidase (beta-lactamase class C family)
MSAGFNKPAPYYTPEAEKWADSILTTLTPDKVIGQLFMVAAYSNRGTEHTQYIEKLITENGLGGVCFFQGGPVRQAILTNRYQSLSKVPMFVSMDAEWGLAMRLDSTLSFPKQMTLGAIDDDHLIYLMGNEVAQHCKRLGVHINFAPVVDINSNPKNPVIGIRSFGEDKYKVTAKALAYMRGMQDQCIMANAKHFPGHGDAESDSHLSLPIINHTRQRFNDVELYPFKQLIDSGIASIMVAHLYVPTFEDTKNTATTLSHRVVTDLLKTEMNFNGLVFTDALNMKGVSSFYKPGEVDVKALLAGNDVLLYAENVPLAIEKINKAIEKGDISFDEIKARAKKILMAKYWCGLTTQKPIELNNLFNDLNNNHSKQLIQQLYDQSIIVAKDNFKSLPIKQVDIKSTALIEIGNKIDVFSSIVQSYSNATLFAVNKAQLDTSNAFIESFAKFDNLLISLHQTTIYASKGYGITDAQKTLINKMIARYPKAIVSIFGMPYSLKYFSNASTLICANEDNEYTQRATAHILFGGNASIGKLPVTVDASLKLNSGINTQSLPIVTYGIPESSGMDSKTLSQIDDIVTKSIAEGAMPGCQVAIIRHGKMVYQKSYGKQTYDSLGTPINNETLYDIASVSKVAGTLQAAMFLQERGLLDVENKISYYLPELKGSNKEDMLLKEVLTHQAGLIPFLPHWRKTVDSTFKTTYYRKIASDTFPLQVADSLFAIASMEDSLWKWTVESPLLPRPKHGRKVLEYHYVYSDLAFYILKRIVEKQINQPMDQFLAQNFYTPLMLDDLMYNPIQKGISKNRIAPTEFDSYFRKTQVQGFVHDPGAAMIGGVAGHAGLFANAHDLAVLMQMNLQKGSYSTYRYLLPQTVSFFSTPPYKTNRRGLGWDKPEKSNGGPCSYLTPMETFGHTGFTGTCVWVDPIQDVVYVFLSNRVCPDASNNRLIRDGIRTKIQSTIYQSILNYKN